MACTLRVVNHHGIVGTTNPEPCEYSRQSSEESEAMSYCAGSLPSNYARQNSISSRGASEDGGGITRDGWPRDTPGGVPLLRASRGSRKAKAEFPCTHTQSRKESLDCYYDEDNNPLHYDEPSRISTHSSQSTGVMQDTAASPTVSEEASSITTTPCLKGGGTPPISESIKNDINGTASGCNDDCEVKRYIIAIGRMLGRKEEDLAQTIHVLVYENWFKHISDLEGLREQEWTSLRLPKQLVRLLRLHLSNAYRIISQGVSRKQNQDVVATTGSIPSISAAVAWPLLKRPWPSSASPHSACHGDYSLGGGAQRLAAAHAVNAGDVCPIAKPPGDAKIGLNTSPEAAIREAQSRATDEDSDHQLIDEHTHHTEGMNCSARGRKESGTEVEAFIWRVCERFNRPQAECVAAVQCLVHDNWFDTLDQLRALTAPQWMLLEVPIALQPLLPQVLAEEQFMREQELERVVVAAGSSLGRTGPQVQCVFRKLREAGYNSADCLWSLSEAEWAALHLPLRLLEEIHRVLSQQTPRTAPVIEVSTSPDIFAVETPVDEFPSKDDTRVVSNKEERAARLMTVDRLLLKVGLSVGKTHEEMIPIIHKIVHENWLDSLAALRLLKPHEWNDLGLPRRLAEALKLALQNPFVLELNTVQFTTPEPQLFPCEVVTAVWKFELEVPLQDFPDSLKSILKLMETILCNPFDESKRVIRKTNSNFQKRAGQYKSARLLLEAVGYEDVGDAYMLSVAYIVRLTEAHAALAQLAQLHRDRLARGGKALRKLFSSVP